MKFQFPFRGDGHCNQKAASLMEGKGEFQFPFRLDVIAIKRGGNGYKHCGYHFNSLFIGMIIAICQEFVHTSSSSGFNSLFVGMVIAI